MDSDGGANLADALRRVRQLEAALARRTELLERKQAELASVQASRAYQFATIVKKLSDRLLPVHTRRRALARNGLKSAAAVAKWPLQARVARNGPSPSERHLSESTPPAEYRRWIARSEPGATTLEKQRRTTFVRSPIISLIVPVFNPPLAFFHALLKSIADQTYSNWELCCSVAGDDPNAFNTLQTLSQQDPRVKIIRIPENRGIAGNSIAAVALATGEFLAFADHDDVLAPFALYEVIRAINANPTADFYYSDEDKLDTVGNRVEPNFKPDWSPETLLSRNYICHLTVMSRTLYDTIGGLREGFDGAQDYDLVLRAGEQARHVVHIPAVLYHWRIHAQSTAGSKSSKLYAFDAGKRALLDHFARTGIDATVMDGPTLGTYQPIYRLTSQPLVSVIVPTRDHVELLRGCVRSLEEASYANYELLIVENGSRDPATFAYYQELESRPNVRILTWEVTPFNYAAINNFAARQARGQFLLFLNNDIQAIGPDWLEGLVTTAARPGVGAVGAKLIYSDDTIQHAGIVIGMGGVAGHAHLHYPKDAPGHMQRLQYTQNVAAVTGACLLTPKTVFDELGGFDEGFMLAFNDVDYCLQVLAQGYRIVWTPYAELYHLESKTRGYEDTPEKQERFKREIDLFHSKWSEFLRSGDPYYSPHFRLDRPDFALR